VDPAFQGLHRAARAPRQTGGPVAHDPPWGSPWELDLTSIRGPGAKTQPELPIPRDRAATLLLRLVLREFFEFHFLQSDPNFANYLRLRDGRIGLIDLGAGYAAPQGLCDACARLFRAALEEDRETLRAVATEIGFLDDTDRADPSEAMLDLIQLATEPFRHGGLYDFGRSDLPARARASSMALVFEHGFWRPPPPETLFLQRKLGGTFLLCARHRARVNARALLEEAMSAAEACRAAS
jgi:hypothetical protein